MSESASKARRKRRQMQAAVDDTSPQRACRECGGLLPTGDKHVKCLYCLGLGHAAEAIEHPERCEQCSVFPDLLKRSRLKRASRMFQREHRSVEDEAQADDPNRYSPSLFKNAPTPAEAREAVAAAEAAEAARLAYVAARKAGVKQWSADMDFPLPDDPDVAVLADDDAEVGASEDSYLSEDSRSSDSENDGDESHSASSHAQEEEEAVVPPVRAPPVVPQEDAPATVAVVAAQAEATPAPAEPQLPYDDTDLVSLFKKAVDRCGQQWPASQAPPATKETMCDRFRKKIRVTLDKPHAKPELPLNEGFLNTLTASWEKPCSASNSLSSGLKLLDCAGQKAAGIESLPPMDKSLAGYLQGINPNTILKDPEFSLQSDKDNSKITKAAYKCVGTAAKALNATTLLQGSVSHILVEAGDKPTPPDMAELRRLHLELLILTQAQTEMVGRAMANILVLERARWLGLNNRVGRAHLDQKISTSSLFASMLEDMRTRDGQTKTDAEIIGACLPATGARPKQTQPYRSTYDRTRDRADRSRSGGSSFKAPEASRAPSASASSSRPPRHRNRKAGEGRRRPSASPAGNSRERAKKGGPDGKKAK